MTAEAHALGRPGEGAGSAGSLIVAVAAAAFSTAGLFTRLIAADVWTMLFWRGLFGGLLIAGYIVWRERAATGRAVAAVGWAGLVTAGCSTIATICFITALRETTVADVTIIYAAAPFVAASRCWRARLPWSVSW
jgi:drug/metabolite transporter (DMT)-like permease